MSPHTRRAVLAVVATAAGLAGSAAPALALNPQPLPPRWHPASEALRPALNPQPLPPIRHQ